MSNLTKGLILLLVVLGIGAGLAVWKSKVGGHSNAGFNKITQQEVELLVADLAEQNPMAIKRLGEDAELRKQQLNNLKELFAFASEAERSGMTNDPKFRNELQNIRTELTAVNYDRHINKDKGPMPPFGFIGEDQVKAFWGEGEQPAQGFFANLKDKIGLGKKDNEMAFQRFLDTKISLLKESNPAMKDREISEEEKTQAREFFAKINIYNDEFGTKIASGELPKELKDKIDLQVKLQQAQFLARVYSDKMAKEIEVTDEDVAAYIAANPEFDTSAKRAKADEILARAKGGEDFAALANEFSEDPGNNAGEDGKKRGGLYENVRLGMMVKPFEEAALALEPGQVSQGLVETDFGYHIVKLEKKGEADGREGQKEQTYDVRHILISTGFKDPNNPIGREEPIKQYVRRKLEEEREKKTMEDLVARNNVQVPEDFNVPQITDEQIQEMMKQQQQQQVINTPGGHSEGDGHDH
ncbi:MAG: peptidylprolyl isomerase [Acidobacteria bacterium]|nr:peptidylprolyl isomerase [Acidobacteriota bacterium]